MADKKTVDKVKELLESNAYAPLKEAAEKWLAAADEKYGDKFDELKEKAAPAMEKLGDMAEKYSEKSIAANEKLAEMSEKVSEKTDELVEKAGPKFEELREKAAPVISDLKEKAAPAVDQLKEKTAPAVDQLKEKTAPAVDQIKEKASPAIEKISDSEFVAKLRESISTLSDNIAFFGSDEAKKVFGEEAAEQIRKHAEEMKAQGKTYCDCPACTKAREILRDLGEDIEEPEA